MKPWWKRIGYRNEDWKWRIAIFTDEHFDLLFSALIGFITGVAFTLLIVSILIGVSL